MKNKKAIKIGPTKHIDSIYIKNDILVSTKVE